MGVEESESKWNAMLKTKLQKREERKWRKKVEIMDKLRTYRTIKTKLKSEEYLKIDEEEAEKLQREMGKRILRLKVSTNNEVVLGELGWWKMKARRDMIRLRYWRKLVNMGKEPH